MPGPTEQTYTLVAADVAADISVEVTATNSQGSVTVESAAVGPVLDPAPANTVAPALSSTTPQIGDTISVTQGTWTGLPTISYAFEWQRGEEDIPGATQQSYTVVHVDAGQTLGCAVTAQNAHGLTAVGSNLTDPIPSLTPTLDTATSYWVAKNTSEFYNSSIDALIDQAGAVDLTLGNTTGADSGDPTFGNDGTHEYLESVGGDDQLKSAGTYARTDHTLVVVASADSNTDTGRVHGESIFLQTGSLVWFGTSAGSVTYPTTTKVTSAKWEGTNFRRLRVNGTTGAADTTSHTVASTISLRLLNRALLDRGFDGKFFGAAFFSSLLSDAAIDAAGTELLLLAEV